MKKLLYAIGTITLCAGAFLFGQSTAKPEVIEKEVIKEVEKPCNKTHVDTEDYIAKDDAIEYAVSQIQYWEITDNLDLYDYEWNKYEWR